jgi:non-specific serine/threonine protein kinase
VIVVHGWWSPTTGRLSLWAEDSAAPAEPPRRRGRRPKTVEHPFALPTDGLLKALDLAALPAGEFEPGTAVLALPARGRGPACSPELVRSVDEVDEVSTVAETGGAGSTALWRVPTVVVDAEAALALLGASEEPADEDRPTFGADLRALRSLLGFALDLVSRGRVLPAMQRTGPGRALAQWRPVVTGADALWLRAAVAALPAVGGCEVADDAEPATPAERAAAAVDALVDAAVRAALGRPAQRRGGARSRAAANAWRTALQGPVREFTAPDDQLDGLERALADWHRGAVQGGAVRACFRLVEPPEPDDEEARVEGAGERGPWTVEFGLQAVDEPSLVVDADRLWRARGPLRALARHITDPQETLLAELGRAVRLYPALEPSLRTAKPSRLTLDTAEAHAFLADAAPLLVAAGFGLILPGWWTQPSMRLGARLRASTPGQPGATAGRPSIGQEGLVEFDWQLAVGDHTLTEQEVAELVEARQPLVRVRGQWIQVDADRLARARGFLSRRRGTGRPAMTVGEVLHALGAPDEGPGGLPVLGVEADGWLGDLLSADERRLRPVPTPAGFTGTLRPYQERGLSWLSFLESAGLGGLLADDMGLGKTVQLLALIAGDADGAGEAGDAADGPTLLVCPMSVVGNWQREAARFTPDLRVHVHHGAERPRGKAFEAAVAAADIVVTTYALLARDAAALRRVPWRRVVLDEAQAIKNAATKAAVAARSIRAPRRIAVTGTPVENRLADLWSLMEFANPALLGSATSFKERFATPVERHGDDEAAARLRAMTQPFVLRRVKTDRSIISDLPAKLEMDVVCSLTGEQAALYQAVVEEMLERIATTSGIERRGLVLATMTRLKQVCNHPAHFLRDGSRLAGRSGKLDRVEETLEEVLAAGEKALLFTQYAEFGEMLRSHLSTRFGREVAFLHGGVAKADRDAMVTRFQEGGGAGPALFVLSLKAGGTGLTLTAANHVIHVDRWWNPAVEDQATDRAFRIGQTKAVQVRKLVCAGTLEEKIAAMIRDKRGLAASIVGTGEGWLTELSTSQLRELFTLDAGSVVE